jgi:putative DNA primase/helicase
MSAPIGVKYLSYKRHAATRDTVDGPVLTEVERHPHPIAEAIRWQIREGEVVQAIGRARGVNRTAANPVDVLVMTDFDKLSKQSTKNQFRD